MRINYVIATYCGQSDKKVQTPKKEALKIHLKNIANTKCMHISQVTIMKALDEKCDPNSDYYEVDDYIKQIEDKHKIPVKIVECENYCYSFGQWFLCYEQTKSDFDYYIFQEDDYFPCIDNYDDIYLTAYKEAFPNNVGVMCGLLAGQGGLFKHRLIQHTSAPLCMSKQTLNKVYSNPLWKGSPRNAMHDIFQYQEQFSNIENYSFKRFKKHISGLYQLSFAFLFNRSDIQSCDILSKHADNIFLYWEDNPGLVYLFSSTITMQKIKTIKEYEAVKHKAYFLPTQWEKLE